MIVRAAVVPYPPLLVPELVVADLPEVRSVRRTCVAAAKLLAQGSRRWIAVAPGFGEVAADSVGTFQGFGVDVRVRLNPDTEGDLDPGLPLPVLIAAWLREQAHALRVSVHLVAPDASSAECRALAASIANETDDPVGLLVLGDGSPRHGDRAPSRPDERAPGFDETVHKALADADTEALLALDQQLAAELGAEGRAPWQVLAGLGGEWNCVKSDLLVPYGVAYHVAVWDPVLP
ncbi:hypothetical protein JOF56_011389 [Kibdelosporangium banguiense]|uniref:Catalytic LigB subunit of aromatic ring-opening dioxygenase n=1 Tax=Kibdelosporangium banguiense TaxID=1365924 RepID=A0ABS4U2W6_9PSEU|nr:hypothetical protein [Kibdelosporangium banguiense]MBP2331004.1 hypothetical protein [Kibdelosporangium banguiense]